MTDKTRKDRAATASGWPKIGDYALIGDCRTAALVGLDGSIDWWCLPHFSGPAFFARLLDRSNGGGFIIRPAGSYKSEQAYLDDTNVLQTRFRTADPSTRGELTLTDGMIIPSSLERSQLLPQRELLRSVEAVDMDVPIEVIYEPRPDYGRARVCLTARGKCGWACTYQDYLLMLRSDIPLELSDDGRSLRAMCVLPAASKVFFSLPFRCGNRAPTTSLPETIGGSRNWDYRYCWLRDASLTLEAFVDLGYQAEADTFLDWLLHSTALTRPRLQVLYDVYGEARIEEQTLSHLEGYQSLQPVRVGNAAWNQRQLDVYGAVIMAAASYALRGGQISHDSRRMLTGLGKMVCRVWRQTDRGLWEVRGPERHHTHSKLMCWAALDCLLQLAEQGVLSVPQKRFRCERDAIQATVEEEGFDFKANAYTGAFGLPLADASLLLLPRIRYIKGSDSRMAGTIEYVDEQLSVEALVYRYRKGFDDMEGEEHPVGICSFWAVDALARSGRIEEARKRFEQLLGYANGVGLYGEEIDANTGDVIGNFPQAFTHVGLIAAAVSLNQANEADRYT